jgi:hypothetical protein
VLRALLDWTLLGAAAQNRNESLFLPKGEAFQPPPKRTLIDGARWDVGAGIVGAAPEPEQIHEDFLAIFECRGFEQRLLLGGMKRERHA